MVFLYLMVGFWTLPSSCPGQGRLRAPGPGKVLLMRTRLAAFLLLVFCTGSLSAQLFIRADANSDKTVDISDAVTMLLYLFAGTDSHSCYDSLDANDDGTVNIADPVMTLGYLFAHQPSPPAPFPEPGLDPTLDPLCCGPNCNPDLSGTWSGTFYDATDGTEYVVCFSVEDAGDGTFITGGVEGIANEILGGELFFWADTGDRRLAFDYDTAFDVVHGDFTLSSDGLVMENGEFTTTSGTEGLFSMVRVSALADAPGLRTGAYRIVFVDAAADAAWGGRFLLRTDNSISEGTVAVEPIVPEGSRFERASDPLLCEAGRYSGTLQLQRSGAVYVEGLVGADSGMFSGVFTDDAGGRGYFLAVPVDEL